MNQLNEAVIKLINQDVVAGKKLIENELYRRLGSTLEEKLMNYAPTIFEKKGKDLTGDGKVDSDDWKAARNNAIKKKMQKESAEMISEEDDADDDILSEEYENMVDDLQALIESIEEESGEELTESEIQELATMLLEEYESDNEEENEDEDEEDSDEEDIEEDSDEDE
jgi:hypothetical protein